ncbi:hypothetical protein DH2020_044120 [Rehmannia glutinosa]|uniref:Uncharacterized protein n=1 Tax=Rehmannia glutinosa TaxID=99300 RepID=A0ABR0UJL2_REHGL
MEVMGEEDNYTKDGTVDYKNNPANRKKTGTWKACPFILGTCYVMPLVGAFLADAYLGRYWTIASFSIIYVIGMTLLTLSASVPHIRPTCYKKDECHATNSQTAICFVALYLVALGTGGIKPCVSSYGADQFDDADEVRKPKKFFLQLVLFFNQYWRPYRLIDHCLDTSDHWLGMGIGVPAVAMAVAVVFFFSGTRLFRYQKPGGSPLTRLCQVVIASLRKYRVVVPDDKSLLYETSEAESAIVGSRKLDHTNEFDKAAVDVQSDHIKDKIDPWRLCTVTQVEELKGIIRFATSVGNRHKNGLTQLQRIGTGLFISIFAMISAGILEIVRLRIVRRQGSYNVKEAPISIFWQVPQYFIIGCAEVFTNIGQLEFFYEQAPDSMRSLCAALSLTTTALGNYLSSLLVTIVMDISTRNGKPGWIADNLNHGHLHYFFLLLAVLSLLNLGAFVVVAKSYNYKKAVGTLR